MVRSDFLKRIKAIPKIVKKTTNTEQENENQAKDLVAKLDAVFVSLPLVNPLEKRVKLPEKYIGIIEDVLSTSNECILKSERYPKIKNILQEILDKDKEGILIDKNYIEMASEVKRFYYSFQDQKYWEEKPF